MNERLYHLLTWFCRWGNDWPWHEHCLNPPLCLCIWGSTSLKLVCDLERRGIWICERAVGPLQLWAEARLICFSSHRGWEQPPSHLGLGLLLMVLGPPLFWALRSRVGGYRAVLHPDWRQGGLFWLMVSRQGGKHMPFSELAQPSWELDKAPDFQLSSIQGPACPLAGRVEPSHSLVFFPHAAPPIPPTPPPHPTEAPGWSYSILQRSLLLLPL